MLCLQGHRLCLLSSFPGNRNDSQKRGQPCDFCRRTARAGSRIYAPDTRKNPLKTDHFFGCPEKAMKCISFDFSLPFNRFVPFPRPVGGIRPTRRSGAIRHFCACHHLQNRKEADARIGFHHHNFAVQKFVPSWHEFSIPEISAELAHIFSLASITSCHDGTKCTYRKCGTTCPTLCKHPVCNSRQVVGNLGSQEPDLLHR